MFEMQVCRSCLSQWKGKDEVLRNWVQISRAILPNLHLRGHSYCWILCILPCHILFLSRALTLKHNLYTEYTKFSKLRCSYVEEEMHISTHKNLTRILTMPSLYGFFSTEWVADQGSSHLFSNWYFGIITSIRFYAAFPHARWCSFQLYHGMLFMFLWVEVEPRCALWQCSNWLNQIIYILNKLLQVMNVH